MIHIAASPCGWGIPWGLLKQDGIVDPSQYVGSFMVEELELQQHVGQLEEQLRALKVGHPHCLQIPMAGGGMPNGSRGTPQPSPLSRPGLPQEEVCGAQVQLAGTEGLR